MILEAETIASDEDLTASRQRERLAWARDFLRTLEQGKKVACGEIALPASRLTFAQKLEMWKVMSEIVDE